MKITISGGLVVDLWPPWCDTCGTRDASRLVLIENRWWPDSLRCSTCNARREAERAAMRQDAEDAEAEVLAWWLHTLICRSCEANSGGLGLPRDVRRSVCPSGGPNDAADRAALAPYLKGDPL